MGLDMYLYAEKYLSGAGFSRPKEKAIHQAVLDLLEFEFEFDDRNLRHMLIDIEVAYWRKANAIHAWFVNNVQGGKDECQRSYVAPEKLQALRDVAAKAAELYEAGQVQAAGELLPPQGGFFFGSTELGSWYLQNLKDTVRQLDKVIALDPNVDIYYRASW